MITESFSLRRADWFHHSQHREGHMPRGCQIKNEKKNTKISGKLRKWYEMKMKMICHLKQDVTGLFGTVTWNFVSDSQSSLCVRGESDLEILPTTSCKHLKSEKNELKWKSPNSWASSSYSLHFRWPQMPLPITSNCSDSTTRVCSPFHLCIWAAIWEISGKEVEQGTTSRDTWQVQLWQLHRSHKLTSSWHMSTNVLTIYSDYKRPRFRLRTWMLLPGPPPEGQKMQNHVSKNSAKAAKNGWWNLSVLANLLEIFIDDRNCLSASVIYFERCRTSYFGFHMSFHCWFLLRRW